MIQYLSSTKIFNGLLVAILVVSVSFIYSCKSSSEEEETLLIPSISSVSPESGEPGDTVTITGKNLDKASAVKFGESAATIVSNTDVEIVTKVPEDATTGKITITTAGGAAESANDFTVVVIGAATISKVSAQSAIIGDTVTLIGTEMSTVSAVSLGDVSATVGNTTDSTVQVVIGDGTSLGAQTFTVVNDGGTVTTSTETLKFYVVKILDAKYVEKFEDADESDDTKTFIDMVGSADAEEMTVHGRSNDATVINDAQDMPPAIDGVFWHQEGFSSTGFSGGWIGAFSLATQPVGTFSDFFGDALAQDIYFNILVNFGDLPDGYAESENAEDYVFGLRFRFDGDDYEYRPNLKSLIDGGYAVGNEANEDGWYDLSIPATAFSQDAALGTFEFKDMKSYGVNARRNYGSGTELPLSAENGGVFWTMSFDNVHISIGGPHSFLK